MSQKLSPGIYRLTTCPAVVSTAAVVGKKEGEGPLGKRFDAVFTDTTLGEKTWEKAESRLQVEALQRALTKGSLTPGQIDLLVAGDLLNQCIGTSFGMRDLGIPFLGLYGACSTMAEGLVLASLFTDQGLAEYACAVTSSHFCAAERQFRYPLEYGGVRPPTAQWTVTGAGAAILAGAGHLPRDGSPAVRVKGVAIGRIRDLGVPDINNMGAAMAPAAADTIGRYLADTHTRPEDYDCILTGDLGWIGSGLLIQLLQRDGIDIRPVHDDCGKLIFDRETQDVHAGGSGCGCSASVVCSCVMQNLRQGRWKNVLFAATGALMSPTSTQQGESIPAISHLVHLGTQPWPESSQ